MHDTSLYQAIQIHKVNKSTIKEARPMQFQHKMNAHHRQGSFLRQAPQVNNYLQENLSLGESEKENSSLSKNFALKTDEDSSRDLEKPNHAKIESMLNNLNEKMMLFNEQRRIIEEQIKQGVHASTTSLLSDSSSGLEEQLTIHDYQSVMESRLGTEAPPTVRDRKEEAALQKELQKKLRTGLDTRTTVQTA